MELPNFIDTHQHLTDVSHRASASSGARLARLVAPGQELLHVTSSSSPLPRLSSPLRSATTRTRSQPIMSAIARRTAFAARSRAAFRPTSFATRRTFAAKADDSDFAGDSKTEKKINLKEGAQRDPELYVGLPCEYSPCPIGKQ